MYRDDLIRAKKAALKLTNEQIAEKSQLNINTVRDICHGKANVELQSLRKVVEAVGLRLSDVFDSSVSLQRLA